MSRLPEVTPVPDPPSAAEDADRQALREATRGYLRRGLDAQDRPSEVGDSPLDRPGWQRLASELGLQGVRVPERLGGSGLGPAEEMLVHEEMGRALPGLPYLSTVGFAGAALAHAGGTTSDELLRAIAAGETVVATVLDHRPALDWRTGPQGPRLHGTVGCVVDAQVADALLVRAADDVLLWVPTAAPGVVITPLPAVDLTRRFARVGFDGAAADVLGQGETAASAADAGLDNGRLALAAECVGLADRALQMTVDYVGVRHQFGRAIGSFQAVKHRCADMLVRLESARSALALALGSVGADGRPDPACLSVARATCGAAAFWVANETIHLHGGIGFTWEHAAHLYYRRARSDATLLDPGGDQLRTVAALAAATFRAQASAG